MRRPYHIKVCCQTSETTGSLIRNKLFSQRCLLGQSKKGMSSTSWLVSDHVKINKNQLMPRLTLLLVVLLVEVVNTSERTCTDRMTDDVSGRVRNHCLHKSSSIPCLIHHGPTMKLHECFARCKLGLECQTIDRKILASNGTRTKLAKLPVLNILKQASVNNPVF